MLSASLTYVEIFNLTTSTGGYSLDQHLPRVCNLDQPCRGTD